MEHEWVERILSELDGARPSSGDPALDAVQTAIFLEDVFDITLRDAEISPDALGTSEAVRNIVLAHLPVQ